MNTKKLEKLEKSLGKEIVSELEALTEEGLKGVIIQAETSIKQAVDELEDNEKYIELKEQLKALSQGLRDVRKFQNAKIQFSLHILEEKGKN